MDACLLHAVDGASFFTPGVGKVKVLLERAFQAAHGVLCLRFEGGRDLDDLHRRIAEQGQQIGLQLGLQFVLARLAREHHHKAQSAAVQH
ncbi:hypothetical protein SDC9_175205 [bioreactor metagenome]|uniref:Uncharacterized protein n=1 Tax=bioreactor metagenome TaxID=1076179 RepID=A0A645GLE5_9ZZZZ